MDALDQLKAEYTESLEQKRCSIVIVVNSVIRTINEKETPDWSTLKQLLHKVAGSSGTYGFKSLSESARALENKTDDPAFITQNPDAVRDALQQWLLRFNLQIDEIMESLPERKVA